MAWWLWLMGGFALLALELATPSGFFILFFGLGALTVGLLGAAGLSGGVTSQWLVFTISSVAYLLLFRGRLRGQLELPTGGAPVDSLVGDRGTATTAMPPGTEGRVEVRGTTWLARNSGERSLEPGGRCQVVRVDGLTLHVTAAD